MFDQIIGMLRRDSNEANEGAHLRYIGPWARGGVCSLRLPQNLSN